MSDLPSAPRPKAYLIPPEWARDAGLLDILQKHAKAGVIIRVKDGDTHWPLQQWLDEETDEAYNR